MSKLRGYEPFADISHDKVNDEVANLVIVTKICFKHPCEEYSIMDVSVLEMHFSNLPQVDTTSELDGTQPFTVSFVNADADTIVDL